VLSQGLATNVLIEPFNPDTGIPDFPVPFCRARSRSVAQELNVDEHVTRVMKFAYRAPRRATKENSKIRALAKWVFGNRASWSHKIARVNPFAQTTIIKDPTASLMLPYLIEAYGFRSVFLIRHPLAFYASFRRLSWRGSRQLGLLIKQPQLLEEICSIFHDFEPSVTRDELASTVWLWRIITEVGLRDANDNREIRCYSLEELSANPNNSFAEMHDFLGLRLSPARLRLIDRMTQGNNRDLGVSPHVLRRASASIFRLSASRIEKGERSRIEQIVGETATALYGERAFDLDHCCKRLLAGEAFMRVDAI
jgi:hypothetical protein